jgi:hypothetical protein
MVSTMSKLGCESAKELEWYVTVEEMKEMGMVKRVLRSSLDQWCIGKRRSKPAMG